MQQDTLRSFRTAIVAAGLLAGWTSASLAQDEKPAEPPARAEQVANADDAPAPTFSKPVVYTGGKIVDRQPNDHIGVSRVGFVKSLRYYVPRGWVKEPPIDPQGLAQFRVPASKDSGVEDPVIVFYDSLEGTPNEILDRWLNEVSDPEWTPEIEVWWMDLGSEHGLNITLFTAIGGTYTGPSLLTGEPEEQPDSVVIGAIIEGSPEGTLYVKGVGHRAVLESDLGWWQRMVRSMKFMEPPKDYRQAEPGSTGRAVEPRRRPPAPKAPEQPEQSSDSQD